MSLTIALDAMGGDHGVEVVAAAALDALQRHPRLRLVLVGDQQRVGATLGTLGAEPGERLLIRHTSQQVAMD